MNSQELETAVRVRAPFVVLVFDDQTYGLVKWKQMQRFGRPAFTDFRSLDFVRYAESFGAKGYRIEAADELASALKEAIESDAISVIDCPVDFTENLKLTERLGKLVCPT